MKKIVLALALAGFVGAGMVTPALACEGGKCKMEHTDKNGKTKKAKKGEKAESCQMMTASTSEKDVKSTAATPMSCCAKKDASKAEKETKEQR